MPHKRDLCFVASIKTDPPRKRKKGINADRRNRNMKKAAAKEFLRCHKRFQLFFIITKQHKSKTV
jgi:hypothetical protein